MNEAIATVKDMIQGEQDAFDAATTDEERETHQKCLEHFNRILEALEAAQASTTDEQEQDDLAVMVAVGAAVGLLDEEQGVEDFKETVLNQEPVNA